MKQLNKLYIIILIQLLAITVVGYKLYDLSTTERTTDNLSSLRYHNDSDKEVKIHYKYYLRYKGANAQIEEQAEFLQPLYHLEDNSGRQLTEIHPTANPANKVTEVSNTITLLPKETNILEFNVVYNQHEQALLIQPDIKYDILVVVEEYRVGKWTPVSQANLVILGDYLRLDKTPVELFAPEN